MSTTAHQHTKTIVVMGEDGTGKATLMGRLMYMFGGVDMFLHEKLERNGFNKYEQISAFCKDNQIEPSFWAPSAKFLLREAAADTDRVDILIYVLASSAETSPTKTNVEHIKARNVIIVVNKMDACHWSKTSYLQAIEQNRTQLQQQGLISENCSIIPISALDSGNILERSLKSPWYFENPQRSKTLFDAINAALDG